MRASWRSTGSASPCWSGCRRSRRTTSSGRSGPRVSGERERVDDETAVLEVSPDGADQVSPGGPIQVRDLSTARLLVLADALAKTVSLARDEREVNAVLDVIEPFALGLSRTGRPPGTRRAMLRLIGQALLVQHRLSGRVAVEEKPDVLWDRPDLERLYARVEDEYELKERTTALKRKLDVIVETARALTDVIESDRTTGLEIAVVALIVTEILLTLVQMLFFRHLPERAVPIQQSSDEKVSNGAEV